jgi:2-oxo-3-hexenedioate decarboxylase/2-keto-4-pentenoate hydratase
MQELPEDLRPRETADAYALQLRLHEHLQRLGMGTITGHKIGCTTPVMQEYLSIPHPCAGGVLDATVRHGDGAFRIADFVRVGVECEIAVVLGSDLAHTPGTYDRRTVDGAVAQVMAAIEVVDDRWTDFTQVSAPTLVADDFFGAGCVLGEPVSRWRESAPTRDLAAVCGRMHVNDEPVGEGMGADILGHPMEALAWLAKARAEAGAPLKAGDFVLLGSMVKTQWLTKGDRVRVELDGLGQVSARFD